MGHDGEALPYFWDGGLNDTKDHIRSLMKESL